MIWNNGRSTDKCPKYVFKSIEKALPQTLPSWFSRDHAVSFIPFIHFSHLQLSGSQCGIFYLWGKFGFLWMHDSGRKMIYLGYWEGGNKDELFNKTDLTWNDPRYREETKIKLSSERTLVLSTEPQASCLPAPSLIVSQRRHLYHSLLFFLTNNFTLYITKSIKFLYLQFGRVLRREKEERK